MTERVCRSCRYRVLSAVATQCPNCGKPLPAGPASNAIPSVLMLALLVGIAGGVAWFLKKGYREFTPPATAAPAAPVPIGRRGPGAVTPTAASVPAAPATAPAATGAPSAEAALLRRQLADPESSVREAAARRLGELRDPQAVAALVRLLDDPDVRWQAGKALGRIATPDAQRALMAAYDRRDYPVMSGAHAFYLERRAPGFEKVLVELLRSENDLAIAQTLILSKNPRLAGPAQAWAAEKGWALVPDPGSPGGVTWKEVAPQP